VGVPRAGHRQFELGHIAAQRDGLALAVGFHGNADCAPALVELRDGLNLPVTEADPLVEGRGTAALHRQCSHARQ